MRALRSALFLAWFLALTTVLSLIFLRTTLDIFAMLGLFMLFGIVKKNGILQVDYTNQLREQGL